MSTPADPPASSPDDQAAPDDPAAAASSGPLPRGPRPEPGQVVARDPATIRALAHPLRLRILALLDDEGEVTATRCAEVTGESVASCSFHLRMLAKYGYVEPAGRRGKERPWRSVGRGRQTTFDPDVPETLHAAGAVASLMIDQEAARVRTWLAGAVSDDPQWLLASTMTGASFYATREELDALAREVEALTDRFRGRWDDPSLRPEGARRARLFSVVNADLPEAPR
ncbi:DNA-binding transcriptional ArsR family regulator [Cellulosimicrobium cellulans]|uniref:ArsR/SmtB family transcription factor n=1 Tax=Cellulosimicrobium cellulans TaxID=1710 RepID=UPI001957DCAD|nr:winged helix-turn-helix domain-containing protein [Cellulosimicrobium cellulans]MBM7819391.1 DNA-binding transcriptional ArsR family regulator [Cellulosimicrobium cellulans]